MRRPGTSALVLAVTSAVVVAWISRSGPPAASAATVTLTASADTYVSASAPSTSYGTEGRVRVDGSPVSRAFLRFDLTGVSGTVQSARLRLHVSNVLNAESSAGGSVATSSNITWTEGTTTWNNQPAITGPVLASFGAVARNTWVELVLGPLTAGAPVTLAITSTNSDGVIYDSRQSGANGPQLILTVDLPPTATPTASPTPTTTPTPPPPGITTLAPVADAFVDGGAPSRNYGLGTQLIVDGSPAREAYLRFNLAAVSGPISQVKLRLHVSNTTSAGTPWGGTVFVVSDVSWGETTLTYANRPTSWGPSIAAFGVVAANSWVEVDVTSAVIPGGLLALGIRSLNTDGAYYDSRESGADGPQLVITAGAPIAVANGITVAAVGDAVCAPGSVTTATTCRHQQVSDLVANDASVQAFLALGDLQYENGELTSFQTVYHASYGRFKAKTKPAPGNHEYNTAGGAGYYTYFGALAGDPSKGYYSFDIGSTWHVIALNSNCAVVACAAGSAQEQWLRADLAATTRACVLAFWHHPRFSSGSHGSDASTAAFWDALQAGGAEVVLSGHDHEYERFAPQLPGGTPNAAGITQFVVGTGGKNLTAFGTAKPNSALRLGAFGVLKLTLGDGAFSWRFVDESGGVLDSGSASCH